SNDPYPNTHIAPIPLKIAGRTTGQAINRSRNKVECVMRRLVWFCLTMIALWCGYWFFAAHWLTKGAEIWAQAQRDRGWAADIQHAETTGFPLRLDTRLTDIRLADPDTGLGWNAPWFVYSTRAYKLNQLFVEFPPNHRLFAPGQILDITSSNMQGTLRLRPNTSLALDHAAFDLADLQLNANAGWTAGISSGDFDLNRIADTDATYNIALTATDLRPGDGLKFTIDPAGRLPDVFQTFQMNATIGFDRPWDRAAIEQARPQPRTIDLKLVQANWGKLELRLAGQLNVDTQGRPTGSITLKATNWRDILQLAVENGVVPRNLVGLLAGALDGLSRASGPPNTLDVPITLADGQMKIGFIPLGPAPRLILR
ncbi:MAG: DUF2125 domain-containing protein, partial [Planktomarina sp.]